MDRKEILDSIEMKLAFLSGSASRITKEIEEVEDTLKKFPMKLSCWTSEIKIDDSSSVRIGFDRIDRSCSDNEWGIIIRECTNPRIIASGTAFLLKASKASIDLRILVFKHLDDLLKQYGEVVQHKISLLNIDDTPIKE